MSLFQRALVEDIVEDHGDAEGSNRNDRLGLVRQCEGEDELVRQLSTYA